MSDAFDEAAAARAARRLIHCARDAALGSLDADGAPNVSHIATATMVDGHPVVLMSDLAVHTRNVRRDARASILFVAPGGGGDDTGARARVTLSGRVAPLEDRQAARERFLRRHPDAAGYVDFADMHLMQFVPERAYLVAGFGRIVTLSADRIQSPEADGLAAMDEGACRHMDEDHRDAMALLAVRLAGAPEGDWRAVGMDSRGIDIACGPLGARVEFDEPIASAGELRVALKRLTDAARRA